MSAQLASIDGEIMAASEATISVTDEGLIRGDGVFEVIRLYAGVPFALEEHLERLGRSARNIRLAFESELIRAEVGRLLGAAASNPEAELLRIMLTRGGRRIMLTEPMHVLPEAIALKSITYSPTRVLDGVKSLSYAANMLASRLAVEQGYDEALLVTPHGHVLEAPTSSIFWIKDGELRTPPLSDHILASITRAIVIEVTGAVERPTTLSDLLDADEAFLASTTREVEPIRLIDDREWSTPGPLSLKIAEQVGDHIAGLLDRR